MTNPSEQNTVTSRLVVEIYRGVIFPEGWQDKLHNIHAGMARDLLFAAAVFFDDANRPLAICWRTGSTSDQFARATDSKDGDDDWLIPFREAATRESVDIDVGATRTPPRSRADRPPCGSQSRQDSQLLRLEHGARPDGAKGEQPPGGHASC